MPSAKKLADQFDIEVQHAVAEAKKKCRYNPIRFIQMFAEHGGVEAARQLLSTGSVVQSGLVELWKCKRLDLSVEAHVVQPKYRELFSAELQRIATERLVAHEFDVDTWLRKRGT